MNDSDDSFVADRSADQECNRGRQLKSTNFASGSKTKDGKASSSKQQQTLLKELFPRTAAVRRTEAVRQGERNDGSKTPGFNSTLQPKPNTSKITTPRDGKASSSKPQRTAQGGGLHGQPGRGVQSNDGSKTAKLESKIQRKPDTSKKSTPRASDGEASSSKPQQHSGSWRNAWRK